MRPSIQSLGPAWVHNASGRGGDVGRVRVACCGCVITREMAPRNAQGGGNPNGRGGKGGREGQGGGGAKAVPVKGLYKAKGGSVGKKQSVVTVVQGKRGGGPRQGQAGRARGLPVPPKRGRGGGGGGGQKGQGRGGVKARPQGGGGGRGPQQGRGPKPVKAKPVTAEDLDADMDSYWAKNPTQSQLDKDMDEYMKKEDPPADEAAAEPAAEAVAE